MFGRSNEDRVVLKGLGLRTQILLCLFVRGYVELTQEISAAHIVLIINSSSEVRGCTGRYSHAYMSVFIAIKVMLALRAFSSFRVDTIRGTIRSAGC